MKRNKKGHLMSGLQNMWNSYAQPEGVRTKLTHPYSYDPITQFVDSTVNVTGTIYSDRLLEWDFAKHDRLCEKHFGNRGQRWDNRSPKLIEAFLRDWLECEDVRLGLVMEYCNAASGFPCWRFDYYAPTAV